MVVFQPRMLAFLALSSLIFCLLALRYDPQKPSARVLHRLTLGTALLLCWNLLSPQDVGVNPLSVLITGCLGLPGAVLTALLNLMAQQV